MHGGFQAFQEAYGFILSNFCGAIAFVNTEVAISWLESQKPLNIVKLLSPPWAGGKKFSGEEGKLFCFNRPTKSFQIIQLPYHQRTSPVNLFGMIETSCFSGLGTRDGQETKELKLWSNELFWMVSCFFAAHSAT